MKEAGMKILRLVLVTFVIGGFVPAMQGCSFLAGAAAGAAGNEALEEEGYELENPVQKEDDDE
jgi:hypothetical protein